MLADLTTASQLLIPCVIAGFVLIGCENGKVVSAELSVFQKISLACPRYDKTEILVFARNPNSLGRDKAHYSPEYDIDVEEMTTLQVSLGDRFCAEMDHRRNKNFKRVLDDAFAKSKIVKKG
jgi:hypothetical protein